MVGSLEGDTVGTVTGALVDVVDGIVGDDSETSPTVGTMAGAAVGSALTVMEPPGQGSKLQSGPVLITSVPSGQTKVSAVHTTGSGQGKKAHPFVGSRITSEPSSHS